MRIKVGVDGSLSVHERVDGHFEKLKVNIYLSMRKIFEQVLI